MGRLGRAERRGMVFSRRARLWSGCTNEDITITVVSGAGGSSGFF
jgi:hypothetical protein